MTFACLLLFNPLNRLFMDFLDLPSLVELNASDSQGNWQDLSFLSTFEWLAHTRMLPQVVCEGDDWFVDLIFVHRACSLCFFRRRVKPCTSQAEALRLQWRYQEITAPTNRLFHPAEPHSICPN